MHLRPAASQLPTVQSRQGETLPNAEANCLALTLHSLPSVTESPLPTTSRKTLAFSSCTVHGRRGRVKACNVQVPSFFREVTLPGLPDKWRSRPSHPVDAPSLPRACRGDGT